MKGTSGNLNSAHRAFTDPIGKPLELKKSRYTPPGWTNKSLFFSPLTKLPGKSPVSRGALKYYNIIGPQVRRLRYARQWSQSMLAAKLQCAGWDISRSSVSKIEARLKFVLDFELDYLVEVLRVELKELFPSRAPKEPAHDHLTRLMNRKF